MNQREEWKWVVGYEGVYLVSNKGNVMSMPRPSARGKVLKPSLSTKGYLRICLSRDGVIKEATVHRLVAEAFIPNPQGKPEVNHIDGNKANNDVSNLEWVTKSENELHSFRVLGKKPNAPWKDKPRKFARKFNEEQIRAIRADERSRPTIAKEYGVSKQTIEHIQKRRIYKEII